MRSKILNDKGERSYALIFDTGDEPVALLTRFAEEHDKIAMRECAWRPSTRSARAPDAGSRAHGVAGAPRAQARCAEWPRVDPALSRHRDCEPVWETRLTAMEAT